MQCGRYRPPSGGPRRRRRETARETARHVEGAEVAVIGASGDMGREIVAQAIRERLLPPVGRLQLVGRADGPGAGKLLGQMSDLTDAYAEVAPTLQEVFEP